MRPLIQRVLVGVGSAVVLIVAFAMLSFLYWVYKAGQGDPNWMLP